MKPSTPVQPFQPVATDLPENWPDLAMGVRTTFVLDADGQEQYLVFKPGFDAANPDAINHVLSQGGNPAHACLAGVERIRREAIPPEYYWPRLAGCHFSTRTEPGNVALLHTVIDPSGKELGCAEERVIAANKALHGALAGCKDMTFHEYSAITVTVQASRGRGKSYGWLFDNDKDRNSLSALLWSGFQTNTAMQEAAVAEAEKAHHLRQANESGAAAQDKPGKRKPFRDVLNEQDAFKEKREAFKALKSSVEKLVLSSPKDVDLKVHTVTSGDNYWAANIILHSHRVSSAMAMRTGYLQYKKECDEDVVESEKTDPVPAG